MLSTSLSTNETDQSQDRMTTGRYWAYAQRPSRSTSSDSFSTRSGAGKVLAEHMQRTCGNSPAGAGAARRALARPRRVTVDCQRGICPTHARNIHLEGEASGSPSSSSRRGGGWRWHPVSICLARVEVVTNLALGAGARSLRSLGLLDSQHMQRMWSGCVVRMWCTAQEGVSQTGW